MNLKNQIMDRDSFDAAMGLKYGRTINEKEKVMLIQDNLVRVRTISFDGVCVIPYLSYISGDGILKDWQTDELIYGRLISFYDFLIQFKEFVDPVYEYGRK